MSQSFGIVEEKLRETEFFLDALRETKQLSFEAKWHFSAFVSAARSLTLAMQATMEGVDGFPEWYEQVQSGLKLDPLARFFIEIRNDSIHKGLNPLGQVTLEHLRDDLLRQMHQRRRSHVIIMPNPGQGDGTVLADAVEVSSEYFRSLVQIVFDCYSRFRQVVDPQWYFTQGSFGARGKGLEDALEELGFPRTWLSGALDGEINQEDAWRVLRSRQPTCLVNDIFQRHLGKTVPDPDSLVENDPK